MNAWICLQGFSAFGFMHLCSNLLQWRAIEMGCESDGVFMSSVLVPLQLSGTNNKMRKTTSGCSWILILSFSEILFRLIKIQNKSTVTKSIQLIYRTLSNFEKRNRPQSRVKLPIRQRHPLFPAAQAPENSSPTKLIPHTSFPALTHRARNYLFIVVFRPVHIRNLHQLVIIISTTIPRKFLLATSTTVIRVD
ncbi:COP1-interacting protein-related [Striga asiatica]|uniref:COP1-interacting protein-related n=1 Tax=Striga asiatica TaxID=4170 RepID=A0A5A7NX49_STRAF|nr:COP1-interacting protein-related [Striga asiatica]